MTYMILKCGLQCWVKVPLGRRSVSVVRRRVYTGHIKSRFEPSMLMYSFNPWRQEEHPGTYEFKVILIYRMRPVRTCTIEKISTEEGGKLETGERGEVSCVKLDPLPLLPLLVPSYFVRVTH